MGLFDFFKKSKPVVPKQEPKKPLYLKQTENTIRTIHTIQMWRFQVPPSRQEWYPLKKERELQFLRGLDCTRQRCYCWNIAPTEPTPVRKMAIRASGGLNMESGMLVQH